jgi:hypothetical protein
MITIDKNAVVFSIGFCLAFFGFILILDELHEFGISFGPFLPDMSVWSVKPLEHWMYGVALIIIGCLMIYWLYKAAIKTYANSALAAIENF